MMKGDVHRFYCLLRRHYPVPAGHIRHLDHVRAIYEYYATVPKEELELVLAWAKKEENGIGLIPATLSSVPVVALILSPFIHSFVGGLPPWAWVVLWLAGTLTLITGVYIHHRHKAYTALHIHLLERLCNAPETRASHTAEEEAPEDEFLEENSLSSHAYVDNQTNRNQIRH